jgi:hypothetical protein
MKSLFSTAAFFMFVFSILAAASIAGLYAVELQSLKSFDEFRAKDVERVLIEHVKAKERYAESAIR